MRLSAFALSVVIATGVPTSVSAQRLPFERTVELSEPAILDVSTIRGKIDVSVGAPGRIVIAGTVTVRVGWDVPANAVDLARRVAEHPPIERQGSTTRLRPPSDPTERRAVTVSYQVQVPPDTRVVSWSESGATSIRGVSGAVTVRTQSSTIELTDLGAAADVTTGSGSVTVAGVGGPLSVTTSSSAFVGRSLHGLRLRTSTGEVNATFVGTGDVDVETGSSAIHLSGVRSALKASTRSGRVSVQGTPASSWTVSTGSGGIDIEVDADSPFSLDALTRSGSVKVVGAAVQGTESKRRVVATVGGSGPLVAASSRSGSIRVTVG